MGEDKAQSSSSRPWSLSDAWKEAKKYFGYVEAAPSQPTYAPPIKDVKITGQTYEAKYGSEAIKTPQSEYSSSGGEAHFGTDYGKSKRSGLTTIGAFVSATSMNSGAQIVNAGRGERHEQFNDPVMVAQIKAEIHSFVSDKVITTLDEAKANYMIDDILDDRKLNGSSPNNPNPPKRQR